MNPPNLSAARKPILLLLLLLALGTALGIGGCVYRPNIQQGNLLEVEDVEQVTPGMTRSQVRYLLGTPMIADPFDPQRWDYVYSFKRGRERKGDRAHFVVHFEGDKVSRVDMLDLPEERGMARQADAEEVQQATEASRAASPPADDAQPPPDVRQPDATPNSSAPRTNED